VGLSTATYFILYLNNQTYLGEAGERLVDELRGATADGSKVKVIMVHENDAARGGCDFGIFFDGRTPQDLLKDGIYNALALALYPGPFWPVSVALVAQSHLGAGKGGKSFTTAGATRSAPPVQVRPAARQSAREQKSRAVTAIQAAARAFLVRRKLQRYRFTTAASGAKDFVAWKFFDRFDTSSDGRLGKQELMAMCTSLGRKLSDAEAAQAMEHLDADRSGEISFDEWYKWWQAGLDAQALLDPEAAAAATAATQQRQATARGAASQRGEDAATRRRRASCAERAEMRETDSKETKEGPGRASLRRLHSAHELPSPAAATSVDSSGAAAGPFETVLDC